MRGQHVDSRSDLGTETIEGSARPFQGVDDVEGGDGLALSMLGVGNGVTDDLARQINKSGRVGDTTTMNDDIRSPRRS